MPETWLMEVVDWGWWIAGSCAILGDKLLQHHSRYTTTSSPYGCLLSFYDSKQVSGSKPLPHSKNELQTALVDSTLWRWYSRPRSYPHIWRSRVLIRRFPTQRIIFKHDERTRASMPLENIFLPPPEPHLHSVPGNTSWNKRTRTYDCCLYIGGVKHISLSSYQLEPSPCIHWGTSGIKE